MTIENNQYPRVVEITKITDTAEGNGAFQLELRVQYSEESLPVEEVFISRPNDPYGVNPQIRQWMSENPDAPVHVYVGPTAEEVRASMPSISARQLRLGLVRGGISLDTVTTTIEAMPAGPSKDEARIEWEYATTFNRMHPLIISVSSALGLSPDQVDTMWNASKDL